MDWIQFQELLFVRMTSILGACILLAAVHWMFKRLRESGSRLGTFQISLIIKGLHLAILTGFAAIAWKWPLVRSGSYRSFTFRVYEDAVNLGLISGYILWYLFQSYRRERFFGRFQNSFGSYLSQYSFFQILLLDILILLRLEDSYLPFLNQLYPQVNPYYFEAATVLLFLSVQGLALWVRGLRITGAPLELESITKEVACTLGLRVPRVRVWDLDVTRNAFATGLIYKSILITRSLLLQCDPGDLRLIIGHECAHFKLHHLEKRIVFIAGWGWVGSWLMDEYQINWVWIFFYVVLGFLLFNMIAQFQELKADQMAAGKLGGGPRMAEALSQTFGMGSSPGRFKWIFRWLIAHPEMKHRVEQLNKLL